MPTGWNRTKLVKVGGLLLFAWVLFFAAGLTYSTTHGYMSWWFLASGPVIVDGSRHGYIHLNKRHSAVIITRTDSKPRHSYMAALSEQKWIVLCGEWHAPQVPAFPIGDVNPPCSIFDNSADLPTADIPIIATLKAGPRSVQFQTIQGHTISASW
jgi:hypothetical protein